MSLNLSTERLGARVYIVGNTFTVKDVLKRELKPTWDGERKQWWVGVAKQAKAEELVAKLNGGEVQSKQVDPKDIRLNGKCQYKGRSYYFGASTADGQRMRLFGLPDKDGKYIEFWANASECEIVKRYQPRERRWYGRTEIVYTTLGSIADFIAEQADPATRRGECSECGHWGPTGEACSECGGEGTHM